MRRPHERWAMAAGGVREPDAVACQTAANLLSHPRFWRLTRMRKDRTDRLGRTFDHGNEPIAHARHGLDVLLTGRFLAERLSQQGDVVVQIALADRGLGPDGLEQF